LAFQKYVYGGNGLKIRKCVILHLNNEYVRKGELNLKELFKEEDVTEEVDKVSKDIKDKINEMFNFISLKNPPKAGIFMQSILKNGYHDCLIEGCISLPDNNVFCLYRGGELSCELFDRGIEIIRDIPDDIKLGDRQSIQKNCEITKKPYVDSKGIKEFLRELEFPIYYLDFETFSSAIPMFDGLKPYSQVPFQFSVHITKKSGTKPEHHAFLYNGNGDPREEFIKALRKVIGDKGTILVYYQSFEKGRLKELGETFPKHSKWINLVLNRFIDLYKPFMEFKYYSQKQQGSASLKKVLPALCEKGYEGMEIDNGSLASAEFFRVTYTKCSNEERDKIRENLLKYCELDTFAEVMIVEKLKELI